MAKETIYKEQSERCEMLEKQLKSIQAIFEVNHHWNKKEKGVANYVICAWMNLECGDIIYNLSLMRQRSIVDELTEFLNHMKKEVPA